MRRNPERALLPDATVFAMDAGGARDGDQRPARRRGSRIVAFISRLMIAALILGAILLAVVQPDPAEIELGALIAMAGLLATVLALGITVTLLVAQHTAERHARALYGEFRQERAWPLGLGALGIGVLAVVGVSLLQPTRSTAFAVLSLMAALGLLGAVLFSRLLDSLDASVLAERVADRAVERLRRRSKRTALLRRPDVLAEDARSDLAVCATFVREGIEHGDADVLRSGLSGIRRIVLTYLGEIPASIGFDDPVIFDAFQQLGVNVRSLARQSSVLLLPVALPELTKLAVEAAAVPNRLSDYEPVSGHLNGMLLDVIVMTLLDDASPAPAMATGAIGDAAVALISANRISGVTDHVSRLRTIGLLALNAGRDHIVGQAAQELARASHALTRTEGHLMAAAVFDDATQALSDIIDAFVARPVAGSRPIADVAMTGITAPLSSSNLSSVVTGALVAAARHPGDHHFEMGADRLVAALLRLAGRQDDVVRTSRYALATTYSAWVGALSLNVPTVSLTPHLGRWWNHMWEFLASRSDPDRPRDQDAVANGLLLYAVYAAATGAMATELQACLERALSLTAMAPAGKVGDRLTRAWVPCALAAIGTGQGTIARAIVFRLGPRFRALQRRGWILTGRAGFDLPMLVFGTPAPALGSAHLDRDNLREFERMRRPAGQGHRRQPIRRKHGPRSVHQ